MLKLFGVIFIIIATSWAGWQKAMKLSARPKQIRALRSFLSMLETEIGYGMRPLEQACAKIASEIREPIASLFRTSAANLREGQGVSTYECFAQAIEQEWHKTVLQLPEQRVLLELCQTLGASNSEDQLKHLNLAAARLETEEKNACEDELKYAKMYKSLGFLLGLFLSILLY